MLDSLQILACTPDMNCNDCIGSGMKRFCRLFQTSPKSNKQFALGSDHDESTKHTHPGEGNEWCCLVLLKSLGVGVVGSAI